MVQFCCVVGCGNRSNREIKRFYRLPNIPVTCDRASYKADIILRRRKQWLLNIRRADLKDGDEAYSPGYIRVCSDHFRCGKPSCWSDVDSIDWAPTIKMGYDAQDEVQQRKIADFQASNKRKKPRKNTEANRARRLEELEMKRMFLNLIDGSEQSKATQRKGKGSKRRRRQQKSPLKKRALTREESNVKQKLSARIKTESADSVHEEKLTVNPTIHKITLDCIVLSPEVDGETGKDNGEPVKEETCTSDVDEKDTQTTQTAIKCEI